MPSDLLKLTALDADDLEVISAHLQDAVLLVGDMKFLPGESRFAAVVNRFDWQGADAGDRAKLYQRRRSGLRFDRVNSVKARNIRQDAGDAVLELLAVRFEAADGPAGRVTLVFAGGGAIRLDVECIEAALGDLGPAWRTENRPAHRLDDEPAAPARNRGD